MSPQIFDFQENPVRVLDQNGQPWFVAADVCRVLDLADPSSAVRDLDDDEKITLHTERGNPRAGIPHQLNLISESGLYALIFKSRKPEAKSFRKWVTGEVLPQIRTQGFYLTSAIDFEKYPAARDFSDLFGWVCSLGVSQDEAARSARSLLWKGKGKVSQAKGGKSPVARNQCREAILSFLTHEWTPVPDLIARVCEFQGVGKSLAYSQIIFLKANGEIEGARGVLRLATRGVLK